jgi:hypothetical protein
MRWSGTQAHQPSLSRKSCEGPMRSIFLWLIGIPLPIILLLAFCTHKL